MKMRRSEEFYHSDKNEHPPHHQNALPTHSYIHHMTPNMVHGHEIHETSQSVGDRINEIGANSHADGKSNYNNIIGNNSGFRNNPPNQVFYPLPNDSMSQISANTGHCRPSRPPAMSAPFQLAPPPPFCNPSIAPPGLPPFHGPCPPVTDVHMSSHRFPPPVPFNPQHNFRPDQPFINVGNVPPQNNVGAIPTPNNLKPTVPPPNDFCQPPPSSTFRAPAPPYNFSAPPPAYDQGSKPFQVSYSQSHSQNGNASSSVQSGKTLPVNTFHMEKMDFKTPLPSSNPREKVGDFSCDFGAQQEVNSWLRKRGKLKDGESVGFVKSDETDQKTPEPSCGQLQEKLRKTLHALAAIQGTLQNLEEEQDTADTHTWETTVHKIKQLQETYLEVKQKLDIAEFRNLKRKLDLRRKKRARHKRRKEEEKEAEQQMLFERAQKHASIDQWRNQINQEYLNQQEVKKMKETADKTLGKVRREIRENRKMLDTVTRLQKLRAIRSDTAEKRGQTFPVSTAEHFTEKTEGLAQLLSNQISSFEKEEAALKLILETEKEEAKEKEKEEKREKEKQLRQNEIEQENISLFGAPVLPYMENSLQPFVNFYQQAQYSIQALHSIRQEWDTYLVSENTPMASRVPDGWVRPEQPSSSVWASVLQSS